MGENYETFDTTKREVILKFYLPGHDEELEEAQNGHLYKRVLHELLERIRLSLRHDTPIAGLKVDTEVTLTDGDSDMDELNDRKKVLVAIRKVLLESLEEKGLRLND